MNPIVGKPNWPRRQAQAERAAQRAGLPPPPPPTSDVLVEFPTGPRSVVRVSLDRHEERTFLNIRSWFKGTDGAWHPTQRGVTVETRDLPALRDAVERAIGRVSR